MLATRKELPNITADLDPPIARSDDLFAGREEYIFRIEECRLGVAGEEFAHLIFPCIAELGLGALDSRRALFRGFTETAGKEAWDILSVL